jgi:hypothetical protein
MRDGCLDFRTGYPIDLQTYFDEKIDIHHIFPQAWCKTNRIDPRRCDCVVNKTPISARTNRMIGGSAPSAYLPRIQKNAGIEPARMGEILQSHLIDATALPADQFDAFVQLRSENLLERIERAMGKPVAREVSEPEPPEILEYETEAEEAVA